MANTITVPVSDRDVADEKAVVPWVNKEALPLLRQIRKALNNKQATIADPAGGGTVDTEARAAIASIIDAIQTFGVIE